MPEARESFKLVLLGTVLLRSPEEHVPELCEGTPNTWVAVVLPFGK